MAEVGLVRLARLAREVAESALPPGRPSPLETGIRPAPACGHPPPHVLWKLDLSRDGGAMSGAPGAAGGPVSGGGAPLHHPTEVPTWEVA